MKKKDNFTNSKISLIMIILLLIFSNVLVILPTTAQQLPNKTTYALCRVMPNPIGVNQEVLIHVGITDYLIVYTDSWIGLTVTVTKPDGTIETLGPFNTDSTGGTGTIYVPTMVGRYTFQTHFPGQDYKWTNVPVFDPSLFNQTIHYEASDSEIVELIVQADPIEYYPSIPLPTEYWTRPIDAQLREWAPIAGNWLAIPPNRFAPYNDAPETAHILWTRPIATGGLVGGELGNQAYEEGDAYEGKFGDWEGATWGGSSVIINGILYYNRFTTGSFVTPPLVESMWKQQGIYAIDLHTGELLWFKNNTRLTFGQLYFWDSFNYHGTFPYIVEVDRNFSFITFRMEEAWNAYDPLTGELAYRIENIPSGRRVYGPKGVIYIYTLNREKGWLTLWNSSRAVQPANTGESGDGSWGDTANLQGTFDGYTGFEWNKTIPTGLPGWFTENAGARTDVTVREVFYADRIIGSDAPNLAQALEDDPVTTWAISLKPGEEGSLIFRKTWQPPPGDLTISWGAASLEDGVYTLWSKEQRAHYGFNINTGDLIWGPTDSQKQLDIYGIVNNIAYGKLFSVGMGGMVYAYDVKTGNRLWEYAAEDPYTEILWSNNWPLTVVTFISEGKIYVTHSEHSPVDPKGRGAPFICLNATTGDEIFRINGAFRGTRWGGNAVIGDSIIATMDTYDQRIYAIGKGPSATSISIQNNIIEKGGSVMIEGMVTDISPGTNEYALKARFPSGVPAVADKDMSEWMLYLYKQFPMPMDVSGVEVIIEAVDPNDNYFVIEKVTTDATGMFKKMWTPETEGEYTIIARFAGTNSYWPSHATTALGVGPTSSPSGSIIPEEHLLISTETAIVIIVVVAAIVVVAFLGLRKRK